MAACATALGMWYWGLRKASPVPPNASTWAMASTVEEMAEADPRLAQALAKAKGMVSKAIADHPVIVFMKGVPSQPQCGYSAGLVEVMNSYPSVKWVSCNVLQDDMIREAVKIVGDWPTLPQLYVNGELIGGYDIVTDMHKTGELKGVLPVTKKEEAAE